MKFWVEYVKVDGVRGCCRCVMNEMQWILIRIQLFRETLSEKSKKLHKPIPKGILGYGQ